MKKQNYVAMELMLISYEQEIFMNESLDNVVRLPGIDPEEAAAENKDQ